MRGHAKGLKQTLTLKEIATLQGCSDERIRQIEKRAFRKIAKAIRREAERAGVSIRDWLYGAEDR
jgi:DNA-directed RNA polymerase sigma subunit (sigma70/sigma32)